MQIKKSKAAILAKSRAPLIVDEIELPDALNVGQAWSRSFTLRFAAHS